MNHSFERQPGSDPRPVAAPTSATAGTGATGEVGPAADGGGQTSLRPVRVLVAALTGIFVTSFPVVILVASLPEVATDLGTSEGVVAWVVTAPIIVGSVLLPIMGRLGDAYGHRRLFLWGLTLCGVTAGLCAAAWDVGSLVVLRSLSQAAGTATHPAAIALMMATYRGKARNTSLGYWALVAALAPALGLAFGGPLVGAFGWRTIFAVQAVAALAGAAYAAVTLKETPRQKVTSFDLTGGLVLMVAVSALLLFLDRGDGWGWASPAILACGVVFLAMAATFVVVERRSRQPMLPLTLMRSRGFAMPLSAEFIAQASNMGSFFIVPFVLHGEFGTGPAETAFLMLPLPIGMAVVSPLAGRLTWTVGPRVTAMLGTGAIIVAVGGLLVGQSRHSLPIFLVAMAIQGSSSGFLRPASTAALGNVLNEASMGVGMATLRMISQVGTALGITVAVATSQGGSDTTGALWAALVLGAVAFVASTQLTRERGTETDEIDAAIATNTDPLDP